MPLTGKFFDPDVRERAGDGLGGPAYPRRTFPPDQHERRRPHVGEPPKVHVEVAHDPRVVRDGVHEGEHPRPHRSMRTHLLDLRLLRARSFTEERLQRPILVFRRHERVEPLREVGRDRVVRVEEQRRLIEHQAAQVLRRSFGRPEREYRARRMAEQICRTTDRGEDREHVFDLEVRLVGTCVAAPAAPSAIDHVHAPARRQQRCAHRPRGPVGERAGNHHQGPAVAVCRHGDPRAVGGDHDRVRRADVRVSS